MTLNPLLLAIAAIILIVLVVWQPWKKRTAEVPTPIAIVQIA